VKRYLKDPDSRLDYGYDWTPWLEAGDSILTSTWVLDPGNPDTALIIDSFNFAGALTVVYLKAGTVGKRYVVTNRITTLNGLIDDRSIQVDVVQR